MTGGQKGECRWQSSCTTIGLSIQATRQPKQRLSFRAHDAKPSDNLMFEILRSSGMPWSSKACREAISNKKEPSADTALQTDLSCGFLKCFVQRGRIVQVQRSRLWLLSFACATETGCGRWGWPLPLLLVACQPLHAGLYEIVCQAWPSLDPHLKPFVLLNLMPTVTQWRSHCTRLQVGNWALEFSEGKRLICSMHCIPSTQQAPALQSVGFWADP